MLAIVQHPQFNASKQAKICAFVLPHIQRTRLYQACALGVTPDENIQSVLAEILYDEYGNGNPENSHMAIYRKLLHALGLTDDQINNPPILPEQQAYIDTMMRITQGQDWLAAIGVAGIAGVANSTLLHHAAKKACARYLLN
ncbi:MAG: iron-containing redox enzyme family protein [Polaromonas sp.]|nr:iron-containing redox enzyme family protein [Polaromonas sp.]